MARLGQNPLGGPSPDLFGLYDEGVPAEVVMRACRPLALGLVLAFLAGGCGGSDDAGGEEAPTQVVIDNDGAFDDIKAILYLLEQPDIEILALTVRLSRRVARRSHPASEMSGVEDVDELVYYLVCSVYEYHDQSE